MSNDISLPSAADINYSDADEIIGYFSLAKNIFVLAGGFDSPREFNPVQRMVEQELTIWIDRVKSVIDKNQMSVGNVAKLLRPYDIAYRILNGKPCEDYLKHARLNLVTLWLDDTDPANQTAIVAELYNEFRRNPNGIDDKFSRYIFGVIDDWMSELQTFGRFRNVSQDESFNRLAFIMTSDIYAYYPNTTKALAVKTDWFTANLPDDISTMDTPTLTAYLHFLDSAPSPRLVTPRRLATLRRHYLSRPDLNPYSRAAFSL